MVAKSRFDGGMPRPRPMHLHREIDRHGKPYWTYRKGHGPRVRINFEYGTEEFWQAYDAAVQGKRLNAKTTVSTKSLQWLIDEYRNKCDDWVNVLSEATKKQRNNIFKQVLKKSAATPYGAITKLTIEIGRDNRIKTPAQARHFLDTMKGLFKWAKSAKHRQDDPTEGVVYPAQKDTEGFTPWTEDDVAKYEAYWPIGTKERVWLAVLLYTGLRRGDVVRLGRQHVKEVVEFIGSERVVTKIATIKTEKSKFKIEVTIPLLQPLLDVLEAGPTGDLTFICGQRGNPLVKESFGNLFSEACGKAKLEKGKAAHGVRKIAATTAAHNGATTSQLNALFGWKGFKMASKYTESMDRAKLGKESAVKLQNVERTSIPQPTPKVGEAG